MKVDIVRNGNVVKSFNAWKDEEKRPESFSTQLLKQLRENRSKVDIKDVRELLMLGADPNYKLMGHTSEDELKHMNDYYEENEIDSYDEMRVIVWCSLAQAISIQSHRPEVIESMFGYKIKANPNLDLSDVNLSKDPSAFFFSARTRVEDLKTHERILDLFVKHGANVNVTDKKGGNVIHECVRRGVYKIIPKLISLGVDPYLRNNQGLTPYDIASETSYRAGSYQQVEDTPERINAREILRPKSEPSKKKGFFSKG
jgi:hypothetical protein